MYVIDVMLKGMPVSLSVQKKEEADAKATYQKVAEAMKSSSSQLIELACERQPDKTVSVLSSEIAAVQMSQKDGTTAASGRPPGFIAVGQ